MATQDSIGFEPGPIPGGDVDPSAVFVLVDDVKVGLRTRYDDVKAGSFDPSELRALGDLLDAVEAVWLRWGLEANGLDIGTGEGRPGLQATDQGEQAF